MPLKSNNTNCQVAATVLILINLIVMICCILLFALGLWMISSPTSLSLFIEGFGGNTFKALLPARVLSIQNGLAISAIAIFVFFISFMGLYGAITRSVFLLFMYTTIVILLLLLECALFFYFASHLVENGIQESDGQWAHLERILFKCCDYKNISKEITPPWSCCGFDYYPNNCTQENSYKQDCQKTISDWLNNYQSVVYTSLVVFHVVLASCSLARRSCSASRSHT